jgi:hypothetical protein
VIALRRGAAVVVLALCSGTAMGTDVVLLGGEALVAALAAGPPCCVVDARPAGTRALRPLPDAIAYRKGLVIKPTAAVVVIADTDENATRIGAEVGRDSNAPRVIAVKGGFAAWKSATAPAQSPAGPPSFSFVIPKNTCEQGEPLHRFPASPSAPKR